MFAGTNIAAIILFGLCCTGLAEIMSFVGLITGQDSEAKNKALICLIVSIVADLIKLTIRVRYGGP